MPNNLSPYPFPIAGRLNISSACLYAEATSMLSLLSREKAAYAGEYACQAKKRSFRLKRKISIIKAQCGRTWPSEKYLTCSVCKSGGDACGIARR